MNQRNYLWAANPQEIARGYAEIPSGWRCLLCGRTFEAGIIYELGGVLYEAQRAVAEHVRAEHGSLFRELLLFEKSLTGLTPHQAQVLRLMHEGLSDREIADQLGAASTAAIRNLRFSLRERERQAKAFLALMEAFRLEHGSMERGRDKELLPIQEEVPMFDERFAITEEDRSAVLKAYFAHGRVNARLPVKEKKKIIVILELLKRFESQRQYTEKEVNQIIVAVFEDFATLRRYMVDYGLLERTADGSRYWVKERPQG